MRYRDNITKDIILCLTHHKNFNIKTRESEIEAVYKINLNELAKELWSQKNLRR